MHSYKRKRENELKLNPLHCHDKLVEDNGTDSEISFKKLRITSSSSPPLNPNTNMILPLSASGELLTVNRDQSSSNIANFHQGNRTDIAYDVVDYTIINSLLNAIHIERLTTKT